MEINNVAPDNFITVDDDDDDDDTGNDDGSAALFSDGCGSFVI